MSNNIIEIFDNDFGQTFRVKIERDTYGDFVAIVAIQEDGPANRLVAQTWRQARVEARALLYAIRACMRSFAGLPYDLPEDLIELADEVIPQMARDMRPITISEDDQPEEVVALLQRLLAEMRVEFHEDIPEDMRKDLFAAMQPELLPVTVVELIRRGMKRRFDASDLRYGSFIAVQTDVCTLRRKSSGEDLMRVSVIVSLSVDDFDLRAWTLTARIGPTDEIKHAFETELSDIKKCAAASEGHLYTGQQ